jgi:transposase
MSLHDRSRAIGLLQAGVGQRDVARRLGRRQATINQLWLKFQQTGSVEDRPRQSRGRVTSRRQDTNIRVQHLRNRFRQATKTASTTIGTHGRPVCAETVRRRLKDHGIRCRRPYGGIVLTPRHRQARLRWARAHVRWTRAQWSGVLFSDESRFSLSKPDGRIRCYRRRGGRFANC